MFAVLHQRYFTLTLSCCSCFLCFTESVEHLGSYSILLLRILSYFFVYLLYFYTLVHLFPKDLSVTELVAFACVSGLSFSLLRVFQSREMSCAPFEKHIFRLHRVIETTVVKLYFFLLQDGSLPVWLLSICSQLMLKPVIYCRCCR